MPLGYPAIVHRIRRQEPRLADCLAFVTVMLSLGGIQAWVEAGGKQLPELRSETHGEVNIGFIEASEGSTFSVCFNIPERSHDYAVRCTVDGCLTSGRAVSKDEKCRVGEISSVAVTSDGSKVRAFQFAATGIDQHFKTARMIAFFKRSAKTRLGTIHLAMTRCVLEQVEGTSDRTDHDVKAVEKNMAHAHDMATHCTSLSEVRFETPRKAYKQISKQADPWCTFLFVYGSQSLVSSIPIEALELEPQKSETTIPRSPSIPHILRSINREARLYPSKKTGAEARPADSTAASEPTNFRPYYDSRRSSSPSVTSTTKDPLEEIRIVQEPCGIRKASLLTRLGLRFHRSHVQDSEIVVETVRYGSAS